MKNLIIFLASLMFACFTLIINAQTCDTLRCNGQLVCQDNFESYPLGQFPTSNWAYTGNSNIYVDNSETYGSTQSLSLNGDIGGDWEAIACTPLCVSTIKGFVLQFAIFISSNHQEGCCHPYTLGASLETACDWEISQGVGLITSDYTGNISGRAGKLGTYAYDTWYLIKVNYNRVSADSAYLTYYINNTIMGTEKVQTASYENSLSYFNFHSGDGTILVDDIKFWECKYDSLKITTQPVSTTTCNTDTASFSVTATGDTIISYQWQVNNGSWNNISTTGSNPTYSGYINSTLTITNPQVSGLRYRCIVSNSSLENYDTSDAATLTVSTPVTINPAFHNQSQCIGDSVGFILNPSSGRGPYSYQWLLNGSPVTDGNGGTNSLYFNTSIDSSDVGKYSCIITNDCNSVTGDVVSLTPVNCVRFRHNISGNVIYDNKAKTPLSSKFDSTVTNVYLYNAGDTLIDDVQTDDNGYYEFVNIINGTYYVTGSTKKAWGGSNPTDALIVNRNYIGMYNITDSLLCHAGDVDSNGVLNPTDALLINRRYIGLLTKYPKISDWKFQKIKVQMAGEDLTQEVKAVCSGDVNASYAPYLIPGKVMSYELGVMSNISIDIDLKKPFDIPIYLNDNVELGAVGIKLRITNYELGIIGIKSDLEGLIYNVTEDGVNVAWAAKNEGFIVNPSQPLFYITAVWRSEDASPYMSSSIQITSESVLADIDANLISTDKLFMPEIIETQSLASVQLQIYPNPFNSIANISYTLPEDANVEMDLYNELGEKIVALVTTSTGSVTEQQKAGQYTIRYDGTNLRQGVYYCRIGATSSTSIYKKTNIMMIAR